MGPKGALPQKSRHSPSKSYRGILLLPSCSQILVCLGQEFSIKPNNLSSNEVKLKQHKSKELLHCSEAERLQLPAAGF